MPIDFIYDEANDILLATATGLVTFAELRKHLNRESTARALGYREIFDASSATTDMTSDQVRALVSIMNDLMKRGPFGPTAVVTKNDLVYGMARMIEILAELAGGPSIRVFRMLDEAKQWLIETRGAAAIDKAPPTGV